MKIALLLATGASLADAIMLQQQEKMKVHTKTDAEIDQEIESEANELEKNTISEEEAGKLSQNMYASAVVAE